MKTLFFHRHWSVVGLFLAIPWVVFSQAPAPSGGASSTGGSNTGAASSKNAPQRSGTAQKPSTPQSPGAGVQYELHQPGTNQNQNAPQRPGTAQNPNAPQQSGANQNLQQPGTNQNQNASQRSGTAQNPNAPQQSGVNQNLQQPGTNQNQNAPQQPATLNTQGTNSAGTISAFAAKGFSLTSPNGTATNFLLGQDTMFLDSEGRNVPRERFTSQMPATVYYVRSGNDFIATRVVATEAPAIFTAGTITEVSPGILVIEQPGASPTPVRYVNNKTTNYVDQNGEPVPPEMIKSGTPVKVFYTKVGDTLLASKVEVQRGVGSGLPKPTVVEDPGTTTTTTTTTTRETKP